MFIHRQGLEYLLPTEWYHSPEHLRVEIERLFMPAWHLVGSRSDLPRPGDYATMDLLGEPILVSYLDGAHHAFLNVCSHRHCTLTSAERGNNPELRCQYHGWEYTSSGYARHIPDAPGFVPLDREGIRLHKFRLEACGDLLFVNLSDDAPDLRAFLGAYFSVIEERFAAPWRQNWAWQRDFDSNWKIPVENTLESYHLHSVHKGLFGGVKSTEEAQEHVLADGFSTLRYDVGENRLLGGLQAATSRLLGLPATNVYIHHLVHPNFVLTINDFLCHAQSYWPLTPTTSRTLIRMFSYRPESPPVGRRVVGAVAARVGSIGNRKVQEEDARVFAPTQRGVMHSRRKGRLGRREERVYVFQRYVRDRCAGPDNALRDSGEGAPAEAGT